MQHINATGDVITGISAFVKYRQSKEPDELRELLHVPANLLVDIAYSIVDPRLRAS